MDPAWTSLTRISARLASSRSGSIASGFDTNAWDLITTSAAAVIMILLAIAALGVGLRVLSAPSGLRVGMTAAVLAVDVVLVTYVSFVDFSSLGSDLAAGAGGGISLGLGFGWR